MNVREAIVHECDRLRDMLLQKNDSYGDSAINPVRIFSSAEASEQLNVRIDDKISRIARGNGAMQEDTEWDLMGYLMMKRVLDLMKEHEQ
jgi:hypothetical protein